METAFDEHQPPSSSAPKDSNTIHLNGDNLASSPQIIPASIPPQFTNANTNTMDYASQVAQAPQSPPQFPASQPTNGSIPKQATEKGTTEAAIVKCSCGINVRALEMLKCDNCGNWQHTVCVGFISTRDKRLETRQNELYLCYHCRFGHQIRTFCFLKKLSLFRKSLAVISAEGFESLGKFGDLMGVSKKVAPTIRDRLCKEGFLIQKGKWKYEVAPKNDILKERIKFYFNQNLTIHPEFIEAQKRDGAKINKRVELNGKEKENDKENENNDTTNKNEKETTSFSTKKRQQNEDDFMSQSPIVSKPVDSAMLTPKSVDSSKKRLKMSIPTTFISYN